MWNVYGPTETTVWSTIHHVESVDGVVPIGRPIANTQTYILDTNLQPVPIGGTGELYIGGTGTSRGYLNRPELTSERFITNPFLDGTAERLYRTGDLARYFPDGNIECLGRVDHQVKIRGFRVELGEIENALEKHPQVKQAAVVVRSDHSGDKGIVGYVVPVRNSSPNPSDLRKFLALNLPEYMLPNTFMMLASLPLTPNAKVDRNALPVPVPARPELQDDYVAARTPTERALSAIWVDVLGLDRVGVNDNFIELGGHSLRATQIVTRLRETFRIELSLRSFFENPTVACLATIVDEMISKGGHSAQTGIPRAKRDGVLPLSFSQERVWFLQRLQPTSIAYNFQCALHFKGPLDVTALRQSLSEIVRRHEVFRTTFPEVDGVPVQVVHDAQPVDLPIVDLRDLPQRERDTHMSQVLDREFQQHFDLTKLPLVRWMLFELDDNEHVLIHIEHHLLHDGWSFNVFLGELFGHYNAFQAGGESSLPELPAQFVDFAIWQRHWMQGEEAARQLEYWKEQLADAPSMLALPYDRPRPAKQEFRGAAPRVEIPIELCESLRTLSREEHVTLFVTMLAAFATLLHRYSDQDDICIGSGVANRRWRETETMSGMVINNIVLRMDLTSNPTFRELLQRASEITLEATANQDVPFDMVVDAIQPERKLSHNPLFQVMFGFHDAPMPAIELKDLDTEFGLVLSNKSAKFDMTIIVIPHSEQRLGLPAGSVNDGLTMIWEHNSDLFNADTIHRMTDYYKGLLEAVIADPDQRISDLPMLTEQQRQDFVVERAQTCTTFPRESTIQDLFEEQVDRSPGAIALAFDDQRCTYSQLNAQANSLAHHLGKLGVGANVPVGMCMERGIDMVVGMLGILKAGGAYVPMDPDYPRQRLDFMLSDTEAPVLLTQQHLLEKIGTVKSKTVCLDSDWSSISEQSQSNPERTATATDHAYVIYTSGSTGAPKGVVVDHRAVVRLVRDTNYVQLDPSDRIAQASNASFDAATFEIWGALLNGACLVGVDRDITLSPSAYAEFLREQRITTLFITTALFNQIAREEPNAFESLRCVMFGGEACDPECVRRVLDDGAPQRLLHVYGPTENTTFSTWHHVQAVPDQAVTIPIGKPISNTQAYIVDQYLNPVPIGVPGELLLAGDGLACGYWNRSELTDDMFAPNPFSDDPNNRVYKTGDRCRWLSDGTIEFLGRWDAQVKIRGFRIELGEIEAALGEQPSVSQAIAVVREDEPGDRRLVAYVVRRDSEENDASGLRRSLSSRLPSYMIPSAFVSLESLPLSPNGKVDRDALPAPTGQCPDEEYIAPESDTEKTIAAMWCDILRMERVGTQDNFFHLGGHSLLGTQLISRIRNEFNIELPLSCVFECPTIAELARYVDATKFAIDSTGQVGAGSDDREGGEI